MAGSAEKVARDFSLSVLRNDDMTGLQEECKKDETNCQIARDAMCTPQDCGDELPTDLELNIVEVFSPTRFHFQLKKDWDKLDTLLTDINIFYSSYCYLNELRIPSNQLRVGVMVAVVREEDDLWYRGVVRNMESVSTVEINYID